MTYGQTGLSFTYTKVIPDKPVPNIPKEKKKKRKKK